MSVNLRDITYKCLYAFILFLFSSPASDGADRPNILVAIADDMSWLHTSIAGCKGVNTPNIDRVAKSGVHVRNGYCGAPGCSQSRAAFFTGRHVWMNEEASTHHGLFPAKFATFPDLLGKSGYTIGFTGKPWSPGNLGPGRIGNPAGPPFMRHKLSPPSPNIKDNDYVANFNDFLSRRKKGAPFYFWFGSVEPHRSYERGSGLKAGKRLEDVDVPPFLPDTQEVRSDFLDYFLEIEYFDRQLGQMLDLLAKAGELENTLVIVTADNGMPMLRAKATCYEYGLHVPMEISWPNRIPGGRIVDDPIGFVDLNATILAAAGVKHPESDDPKLAPVGRNLLPVLTSDRQGVVDSKQQFVFAGHERHTLTRYQGIGYPIRVVRTPQHLFIRNLRPDRWPIGDPQRYDQSGNNLLPRHVGCYRDVDDITTLDWLRKNSGTEPYGEMFSRIVGKHPAEELYDIQQDPGCIHNLATDPAHQQVKIALAELLDAELKRTNDPRLYGTNPDIADSYPNINEKQIGDEKRYPPPTVP